MIIFLYYASTTPSLLFASRTIGATTAIGPVIPVSLHSFCPPSTRLARLGASITARSGELGLRSAACTYGLSSKALASTNRRQQFSICGPISISSGLTCT